MDYTMIALNLKHLIAISKLIEKEHSDFDTVPAWIPEEEKEALDLIKAAIIRLEGVKEAPEAIQGSYTRITTERDNALRVDRRILNSDIQPSLSDSQDLVLDSQTIEPDQYEKTLHPCRTLWNRPSEPSEYSGQSNLAAFERELTDLINKHSLESASSTPDFILAGYLVDCLTAFNRATSTRQHLQTPGES